MEVDDPNRIPSNIMLKTAYPNYTRKRPNYITETITEIYNYIFSKTNPNQWENLEIEAKLGRFTFLGESVSCMEHIKETFKIPNFGRSYHCRYDFRSSLDESQFYSIWYFIDKESEYRPSEIIKLNPINIKDYIYKSGKRKSVEYINGQPVKEEVIEKEDKLHINIRDGGNDVRITTCKEMKTDILEGDIQVNLREKFRVSYKFRFFRLDFTIVSSSDIVSYEIEFEIDEIKAILDNPEYQNFENFYKIFIRFIQNAFCFYQATTIDYYNNRFPSNGKPRDNYDSLFGDYLEKNVDMRRIINENKEQLSL